MYPNVSHHYPLYCRTWRLFQLIQACAIEPYNHIQDGVHYAR